MHSLRLLLKGAGDRKQDMSAIKEQIDAGSFADAWESAWRKHWERTGFTPYELPAGESPSAAEREFLMSPRTPDREHARLKRITDEFEQGFRSLRNLGPAVTVFGSARFKPDHPCYELGRDVGRRLA